MPSYSRWDKAAVEELARHLAQRGVRPRLDEWNLVPGKPWEEAIEVAVGRCASCVVCLGPTGTGPWQNEEMRAAIDRRVREGAGGLRVIPVLLPGAERGERSRLPVFLARTTWVEFHRSIAEEHALHRLVAGIRGVEPGPAAGSEVYAGICPYRGLEAFDEADAPFFFGREALTEWLLDALPHSPGGADQTSRFLAIVGPSGSGKSSLARAGLLAALGRGRLERSAEWPIVSCHPGADPLEALAIALTDRTQQSRTPAAVRDLIDSLRDDERTLHLTTRLALGGAPPERRLVLFVDQFEEIFTLCSDDRLRAAFIANLLHAATVAHGQTVIVLTMPADFYGNCAVWPSLAAALSEHQMLVGPMDADELRRAIERPAQLVGCEFESGLVDVLIRDVQDQAGGLPLLQHVLPVLWNRRTDRRLTQATYQAIGGVAGALERRAELVYAEFTEAERTICRHIFLRLTQPGKAQMTPGVERLCARSCPRRRAAR